MNRVHLRVLAFLRIMSLLVAVSFARCDEDDAAPTGPISGSEDPGFGGSAGSNSSDGGTSDTDLPTEEANSVPFCVDVTGSPVNFATVQGGAVTAPTFRPSRGFITWDPSSCANPRLVISLTEDSCVLDAGTRLSFRIEAAAVSDLLGEAFVTPGGVFVLESAAVAGEVVVDFRIVDNNSGLAPGIWGNCNADATGLLTFGTFIGLEVGSVWDVDFTMTLPSCSSTAPSQPAIIDGNLSLELQQPLSDFCS